MSVLDRDQLRRQLRLPDAEAIFALLDRAVDELTDTQLRRVLADHIRPVETDTVSAEMKGNRFSLAAVERFDGEARAAKYYQSFNVNSKNYTQKSAGTIAFHAEFSRLLRACLAAPREGNELALCRAFALLFGLMHAIDECGDDIVFYADEGGAWDLCVQWPAVFDAWCPCLAVTASAGEYAEQVARVAGELLSEYERAPALAIALVAAEPEQRVALEVAMAALAKARRW